MKKLKIKNNKAISSILSSSKSYNNIELTGRIFDGLANGRKVEIPIIDAGYVILDNGSKALITKCYMYTENADNAFSKILVNVELQFVGDNDRITDTYEVFDDMFDLCTLFLKYKNMNDLIKDMYETVAETVADMY